MQAPGERIYHGDYRQIFPTPLYEHPVRSIFRAESGHVLVEADLVGAELAAIAWASGDANMIDHVHRNELPESHPDHYDIHSRQAVKHLPLELPADEKRLAKCGPRPVAGCGEGGEFRRPYGRAMAIARQCREEGVNVTPKNLDRLIDAYFACYPRVNDFLEQCRSRSQPPFQWLMNFWGHHRHFTASTDRRGVIGDQERQAQNCTIQGAVADAINCAIYNFGEYRQVTGARLPPAVADPQTRSCSWCRSPSCGILFTMSATPRGTSSDPASCGSACATACRSGRGGWTGRPFQSPSRITSVSIPRWPCTGAKKSPPNNAECGIDPLLA